MDRDTMLKHIKSFSTNNKNIDKYVTIVKDKISSKYPDKNLDLNLYPLIRNGIDGVLLSRKFNMGFINKYDNLMKKDNLENIDPLQANEKLLFFFKSEINSIKNKVIESVIDKMIKEVDFHLFYLKDIQTSCNRMPPKTISTNIKLESKRNNHVLIGDDDECKILGIKRTLDCNTVGFVPCDLERPPYLNKHDISVCDFKRNKLESADETERQRLKKLGLLYDTSETDTENETPIVTTTPFDPDENNYNELDFDEVEFRKRMKLPV